MANITIYTSKLCGYCYRAKKLLDSKSVSYDEIGVDLSPAKRKEMTERAQQTSVPQIFINEQHIGGCDDLYQLEQEGKLDALLSAT